MNEGHLWALFVVLWLASGALVHWREMVRTGIFEARELDIWALAAFCGPIALFTAIWAKKRARAAIEREGAQATENNGAGDC